MKFTFEFDGLAELQKQLEVLASDAEINKTNKRIFKRAVDYSAPKMKEVMAKSGNYAKSGKKGYRPPGHAADNIPMKATAKYGELGWTLLGDAENWFYMKFVEWGTTKQPPQDFIYNTIKNSEDEWGKIANEEYQKLLNEKLGG